VTSTLEVFNGVCYTFYLLAYLHYTQTGLHVMEPVDRLSLRKSKPEKVTHYFSANFPTIKHTTKSMNAEKVK